MKKNNNKAPELPESWWRFGVLDAFEYGASCWLAQSNFQLKQPMDEDCLFMNIFVPGKNSIICSLEAIYWR